MVELKKVVEPVKLSVHDGHIVLQNLSGFDSGKSVGCHPNM